MRDKALMALALEMAMEIASQQDHTLAHEFADLQARLILSMTIAEKTCTKLLVRELMERGRR